MRPTGTLLLRPRSRVRLLADAGLERTLLETGAWRFPETKSDLTAPRVRGLRYGSTSVMDILDLVPFNNQLAELQEEYIPSYPQMSPVTSAFFAGWMVLDAQDAYSGETLWAKCSSTISSAPPTTNLSRRPWPPRTIPTARSTR